MSSVMLFSGTYSKTIDKTGRIGIPSAYLKCLGDEPKLVCYIQPGEKCIRVYDYLMFEDTTEDIIGKLDKDSQPRFMRLFSVNSKYLEPDSRNRVTIPRRFLEKAGIKREVVLLGVGTRFEIWDIDTYYKLIETADTLGDPAVFFN